MAPGGLRCLRTGVSGRTITGLELWLGEDAAPDWTLAGHRGNCMTEVPFGGQGDLVCVRRDHEMALSYCSTVSEKPGPTLGSVSDVLRAMSLAAVLAKERAAGLLLRGATGNSEALPGTCRGAGHPTHLAPLPNPTPKTLPQGPFLLLKFSSHRWWS